MSSNVKSREKLELLAGAITLFVAALLLVATVLVMTHCSAVLPPATSVPATTVAEQTWPDWPTEPSLIPNPYGPADFSYENGYLACISGPSMLGVDVSEYQGKIDWKRVKNAGVEFAIIRLGFRAWGSQGEILPDSKGLENLQGAREAGVQVGVYFFSQAITVEEAREEAQFVLQQLDGQPLDMPIVFDWEFAPDADARTANMTASKLNACTAAFCQEIRAAGYEPMVYFNLDIASRMLNLRQLQQEGYPFWLAMYTDIMTYPYRVDMWQYSCGGTVDGIPGPVDLNLYFPYE